MSDHGSERAAPDPGDTRPRTSSRKRKATPKASGVGAATEEEVAAASRARADDTIIYRGKRMTKAAYEARYGAPKTRGPRPASLPPPPPKAKKIVERLAGPSRDASVSTDGALAASSSTDGGGCAGAVVAFGGYNLRRVQTVPDAGDAADEEEIEASLDIVYDGTPLYGKPAKIEVVTPYTDMLQKLWTVAAPSTKRDIVAMAAAETKYPMHFRIADDAHAKFSGDIYLRRAVPCFAHSHTLSLEADPNTKMSPDDADGVWVELLNHGRAERGQPLITADDMKAKPLFRRRAGGHHDPIKANWAELGTNLSGWPTDATGALDPDKQAIFNGLSVHVAVTKDNQPVPNSCMRLVRTVVRTVDPTVDISIARFNKPGKPESNKPTLDRLNAFFLAFLGCDVDCGNRTCPFPAADRLKALGKTAHEYVLGSFAVSLCEGTVKHKLKADGGGDDAELAELVGRVTPERVAAVVKFVGSGSGWQVDTNAAAWADMGITLADVVEFIKYVDEQAEEVGVMARV